MKPIIRNILAVIVGWFGGSVVNMALIQTGHKLFPIEGIDINDMNAFADIMPTLECEYFIFPFLAHALGTLCGALIAGLIATSHKLKIALAIGGLFLLGGIIINYILPGPTWFAAVDILIAYIPMAWIGGKMAIKLSGDK
jgi:hypothetical protein